MHRTSSLVFAAFADSYKNNRDELLTGARRRISMHLESVGFRNMSQFVIGCYEQYDDSHNILHIADVLDELAKICEAENRLPSAVEVIAAAVHDVVDRKYANVSMTDDEFSVQLAKYCGQDTVDIVMNIITNMSWTRTVRGDYMSLHDRTHDHYRRCVQGADWITAMGFRGIFRSETYNRNHYPECDSIAAAYKLYEDRINGYVKDIQDYVRVPAIVAAAQKYNAETAGITIDEFAEFVSMYRQL